MKYDIEFTATAKSDLINIASYIAQESKNKEIGKRFLNELREACGVLDEFPDIGAKPRSTALRGIGYRFLTHKDYLIFYSKDDEAKKVYIQAIFNAKKDYARVLKDL